jgi:hypothetical protein
METGGEKKAKELTRPGAPFLWRTFALREAIWLGFCATFIVITRAALRLHLKVPGHAMFFTMFFLLMGRGCVRKAGAATLVGLVSGILSVLLGLGKGGPLILLKFVLPGLIVDAAALLAPRFFASYALCLLVGMTASSSRLLSKLCVDWLIGMEEAVMFRHILITSVMNVIFGGLGSLPVPPLARRLQKSQLI